MRKMKILTRLSRWTLLWSFFFLGAYTEALTSLEAPVCSHTCTASQICMNTFGPSQSRCMPIPTIAPLTSLTLPFDVKTEVACTHSSGSGSHSGKNAYFALDLSSGYQGAPALVRASDDGIAFIFSADDGTLCPLPKGTPSKAEGSPCGDGWGNRVKVLHAGGYYSFYTHLQSFLVKNGQPVKQGDHLGIEGYTGQAGHRHVHWSVQKLPGATQKEWLDHIAWVGESVPFRFSAKTKQGVKVFNSSEVRCAHASVGKAPAEQQPRFRGIR